MDYSKIDTLLAEYHDSVKLQGRLDSLTGRRKKDKEGEKNTPKGLARAIRMTKAAINRAKILECSGSKTSERGERYQGIEHFGLEEIRYQTSENGLGQGRLAYVILTIKGKQPGSWQYLVLSNDRINLSGYPDSTYFNNLPDARYQARIRAEQYGAKYRRSIGYGSSALGSIF